MEVTLNTTNEIKMKSNEESGVWEEQEWECADSHDDLIIIMKNKSF